jgi:hypothetical protein
MNDSDSHNLLYFLSYPIPHPRLRTLQSACSVKAHFIIRWFAESSSSNVQLAALDKDYFHLKHAFKTLEKHSISLPAAFLTDGLAIEVDPLVFVPESGPDCPGNV